jgi:hypothetical protein
MKPYGLEARHRERMESSRAVALSVLGRPSTQRGGAFDSYSSFNRSSPASIMGDSPIKLKSPRPRPEIVPNAPTRRTKANAQAFGNRYEFGASLNTAIQNVSAILGDQKGLTARLDTKQSSRQVPASGYGGAVAPTSKVAKVAQDPLQRAETWRDGGRRRVRRTLTALSDRLFAATPDHFDSAFRSEPAQDYPRVPAEELRNRHLNNTESGKPSLSSQAYKELVDKYCFVGSRTKTEV